MKTGTTYVQNLLEVNTEELARQGWWTPHVTQVVPAVRQVMSLSDDGRTAVPREPLWAALMDRAREHAARPGARGTVISMEFLSFADAAMLKRITKAATGLELRVVMTVRDAARAIPSQWQSLSRNGAVLSWPEFAASVVASEERRGLALRPPPGIKAFRRTQDIPRMLAVWAGAVDREHFAAITVPAAGGDRDELWRRFGTWIGWDVDATTTEAPFDNPQLGYGSCDLFRRLNEAGLSEEAPSDYRRVMRKLARRHLLQLRESQSRPRLDAATAGFAARLNTATLAEIDRVATLVGDAADLPTDLPAILARPDVDPGDRPADVGDDEVRTAARAALRGVRDQLRRRGIEVPERLRGPLPGDLDAAVVRLAALLAVAMTGDPDHELTPSRRRRPR